MRSMFWVSILSAALLGGTACKKSAEEKAQAKFEKAQEDVKDQREDLRDEQKDVAKEKKDVRNEQQDVNEEKGDLVKAQSQLAAARVEYRTRLNERLRDNISRARTGPRAAASNSGGGALKSSMGACANRRLFRCAVARSASTS